MMFIKINAVKNNLQLSVYLSIHLSILIPFAKNYFSTSTYLDFEDSKDELIFI